MESVLKGSAALVTGASRGFGLHIARAFVRSGASVWLTARSDHDLLAAKDELSAECTLPDQRVEVTALDLGDRDALEGLFSDVHARWPQWNILVNNAATQGPIGPLWTNAMDDWEQTLRVDLFAPVALCRLAAPVLSSSRRGKIINISGGGATGPRVNFSAYASAKAALVRFSETLAEEARTLGVDVNCVAPGAMNSLMTREVVSAGPERSGVEYEKAVQQLQGEGSSPERAAALCVFLASQDSDGITGKLISAMWDPWETLAQFTQKLAETDVYTLRRIVPADRGFEVT